MDYCLFQFGAFKFFLRMRLHGGSISNFNLLNANTQNCQCNRKVHRSNCLDTNFLNVSYRIQIIVQKLNLRKPTQIIVFFNLMLMRDVDEFNTFFIYVSNVSEKKHSC